MSATATVVIDDRHMTEAEARKITTSIQLLLDSAQSTLDRLELKVTDAYQRRADLALGYDSWEVYANAEFADKARYLPRADRREFTIKLAERGMSTRAISPVVGVSQMQVSRDIRSEVKPDVSPGPEFDPTPILPPRADDWSPAVDPAPVQVIHGLDRKTYTAPAMTKQRNRPKITDSFSRATNDLFKAAERLERISRDDRFASNRETLNDLNRGWIYQAVGLIESTERALFDVESSVAPERDGEMWTGGSKKVTSADVLERNVASLEATPAVLGAVRYDEISAEQAADMLPRLVAASASIHDMKIRLGWRITQGNGGTFPATVADDEEAGI